MSLQLKIRDMEMRLSTPDKFQFPFFELTHWYAAPAVLRLLEDNLKEKKVPPPHLLEGVRSLVATLKSWLNKSIQATDGNSNAHSEINNGGGQDESSQEVRSKRGRKGYECHLTGGTWCLAPQGINCRKIIKDLNKALKLGDKKRKDFEAQNTKRKTIPKVSSVTLSSGAKRASSPDNHHLNLLSEASAGIRTTHVDPTDSDSEQLVVDEQPPQPTSIRIKLQKGDGPSLYQVTEAPVFPPLVKHEKEIHEDPEILEMIKDRPEDGEYIYLDVETGMEEDEEIGFSSGRTKDESWTPRAKVVIKGVAKTARPSRENARREVVETCIANAAAKLEHVDHVKRRYVRRKSTSTKSSTGADVAASAASVSASGAAPGFLPQGLQRMSSAGDGVPDAGFLNSSSSSGVNESSAGSSAAGVRKNSAVSQPPQQAKAKKGLKTAKQRLAKVMKISRRF